MQQPKALFGTSLSNSIIFNAHTPTFDKKPSFPWDMNVKMRFQRKHVTKLLFATCVTLILGELLARFGLGLGNPPLTEYHPRIEYLFRPNQRVYRFGNRFETNAWGMRSDYFPRSRLLHNEYRILMVGDSVINGGSLTDQDALATSILQKQLSQNLNCPVTVGNVSAGSWGPENFRAYFEEYGLFDADLVILVINREDLGDVPTFFPMDPKTHPTHPPLSALTEAVFHYLPRYLPTFALFVQKTSAIPITSPEIARDLSKQSLSRFLANLETNGIPCLAILHCTRDEVAEGRMSPELNELAQIFIEHQIVTISTLDIYRRAPKPIFRDYIHLTEAGQAELFNATIPVIPPKKADR